MPLNFKLCPFNPLCVGHLRKLHAFHLTDCLLLSSPVRLMSPSMSLSLWLGSWQRLQGPEGNGVT